MTRYRFKGKGREQSRPFFHLHAHSHYSAKDAMGTVPQLVDRARRNGQPGLALTDHGYMAGTVELYRECAKAGLKPFPGVEAYFVHDRFAREKGDPMGALKRYHMGLVAFTTEGYHALVQLVSESHSARSFYHKPLIDWALLAEWSERDALDGLLVLTGCYFGLVQQTLVDPEKGGLDGALGYLESLAKLAPNLAVELQHHDITHDDGSHDSDLMDRMWSMAVDLELPVAVTQDAHYCSVRDIEAHDAMKRMVSFGPDTDDATFPGDGFHLAANGWMVDHNPQDAWEEANELCEELLDLHDLQIPELDSYHYAIPRTVEHPQSELEARCSQALEARGLLTKTVYSERLAEELDVIRYTDQAGYLLLVAEITDWCHARPMPVQARGSALGSIVCWLLRITQADPIKYKLRYERFISRDRTKPADIDLDVPDSRRMELIDYLRTRYHVTQIGTWSSLGITDKDDARGKPGQGSLVRAWNSMAKRDAEAQGRKAKYLPTIWAIRNDRPDDARMLQELDRRYQLYSGVGTHAAGFLVTSDGARIEQLVPTMRIASSKTTVTQYPGPILEDLGLVKMDILGLRTLATINRCVELLGWDTTGGFEVALGANIPMQDKHTFAMLRSRKTGGVFQLEGPTSSKGCAELGVRSVADIILLLALYRPAVMQTGMHIEYIERRKKRKETPRLHELCESTLWETRNLFVYQEQIISLCRDLGFDPEHLTGLIKIIKASQTRDMAEAAVKIKTYAEEFYDRCTDAGIPDRDAQFCWDSITGFTGYGFNRSHATAYGITAYRSAWLKCNSVLEYGTALLYTTVGTDKEKLYRNVVRREMGVRLLPPDVNVSESGWTIDRKRQAARRGLRSIKHVGARGAAELEAMAPFASMEDLIERCSATAVKGGVVYLDTGELTSTLAALAGVGALKSLGVEAHSR